jgi:hypothetical protein
MGALEFIASIIGSLAWPGVVLLVLWYNRQHLANLPDWIKANLPDWIEEITFPGGVKAKIRRKLDKATAQAERLKSELPDAEVKDAIEPDPLSDLADRFPESAIIESFREVEPTIWKMFHFLPSLTSRRGGPGAILTELVRLGYIDENTVQLFKNLKDARDNTLLAIKSTSERTGSMRLWPEQAHRYREAAKVLNIKLREVLTSLERDNPRKKEWGTP